MNLVNVVQRQRYRNELNQIIRQIAPELLHSSNHYHEAVEKMYELGVISPGEKTYFEVRLQAKMVILMIEELLKDKGMEVIGSIAFIDKSDKEPGTFGRLIHLSGPHAPDEYVQALDGLYLAPFVGTCGRAVAKNTPVPCYNILEDVLFKDFWDIYERYHIRSVMSFPIHVEDEIIGTLSLFCLYDLRENPGIEVIVKRKIEDLENVFARLQEAWQNKNIQSCKLLITEDTVYYAEESVREIFGLDPDEAIGVCIFDFIHPDDHELVIGKIEELKESLKSVKFMCRDKNKDGNYFTIECLLVPVTEHNELRYMECFIYTDTNACIEYDKNRNLKLINGC